MNGGKVPSNLFQLVVYNFAERFNLDRFLLLNVLLVFALCTVDYRICITVIARYMHRSLRGKPSKWHICKQNFPDLLLVVLWRRHNSRGNKGLFLLFLCWGEFIYGEINNLVQI
jgi:hypothetical protein